MNNLQKRVLNPTLAILLSVGASTAIGAAPASAGQTALECGTCIFENNSYNTAFPWWKNTSGVDSNLNDNNYPNTSTTINDTSSAWSDSTTSSTYDGMRFYFNANCNPKNTSGSFWVARGSQFAVTGASDFRNDVVSSFKLRTSTTPYPSC